MDCWYANGCNLYKPDCQKVCHRYLEMKYLISNCGMPNAERYIKPIRPEECDLPAYKRLQGIKDNIVSFVEDSKQLYIVSDYFGNGKTTWALKILYKYFDEIWCGNGFRVRGYFVYVPEFLNKVRNSSFRNSEEYKSLSKILNSADLVVWDDIASTNLDNYDHSNLVTFIDPRILKGKSNIYTGNLQSESLANALGNRLYSRVWDASEVVELKGRSRRT